MYYEDSEFVLNPDLKNDIAMYQYLEISFDYMITCLLNKDIILSNVNFMTPIDPRFIKVLKERNNPNFFTSNAPTIVSFIKFLIIYSNFYPEANKLKRIPATIISTDSTVDGFVSIKDLRNHMAHNLSSQMFEFSNNQFFVFKSEINRKMTTYKIKIDIRRNILDQIEHVSKEKLFSNT